MVNVIGGALQLKGTCMEPVPSKFSPWFISYQYNYFVVGVGKLLSYTVGSLVLRASRRCHSTIKSKYQSLVGAEKLDFDPLQLSIVEQLQELQDRLHGYTPSIQSDSNTGLLNRVCCRYGVWVGRLHGTPPPSSQTML